MKKTVLFFTLLLWCAGFLSAQNSDLYMPREIRDAYANGTRSFSGEAGKNYFQNHADYQIQVSLDPKTGLVEGSETIVYQNNSPDSLRIITFRFLQNFYKKNATRDFPIDPRDLNDGVKIKSLTVGTKVFDLEKSVFKQFRTNLHTRLETPLPPNSSLKVKVSWSFTMPKYNRVRYGYYNEKAYFVAFWYPQIAVYDDVTAWDGLEFTGQTEFYNDFNNYDVQISVPKNYLVWATGVLQNPKQVLAPKIYKRYMKSRTSDEIWHIVDSLDLKYGELIHSGTESWHFKAKSVSDFAFATSKTYLWDASSVVVDKKTGRRTAVSAAYDPKSADFYEVAEIARQSLDILSNTEIGVPFPYPQMTVFNGGGGMEYPMIVNDGAAGSRSGTVYVTSHEIAHNYIPFYVGTNEKKYAWMDEGFVTFFSNNIQYELEPSQNRFVNYMKTFSREAGKESELPLMIPSNFTHGTAYRKHAYLRPAVAVYFLRDYLGNKLFSKALREYVIRWKQKHPTPYDLFFTFNQVTGKNLNWFWKSWFFESGYPDLAIETVTQTSDNVSVVVKKHGNIPVPVHLTIYFADGSKKEFREKMDIWNDSDSFIMQQAFDKKVVKVELGDKLIPDSDSSDNVFKLLD